MVSLFGKEINAETTLGGFYVVATVQERKLYRCARNCWKNSKCSFVNYVRRFQLCILVGSKWNGRNWEASVVEKPGSVLVVKNELLAFASNKKDVDVSIGCGPHEEPQHGVFLGNLFTAGSKTIHTCEIQPDRFVTYECTSGTWSVVPRGGLTALCCETWKLNNSRYSYDPNVSKTVFEADEQCKDSGGYLIHIETMEEQNLIRDMMKCVSEANYKIVLIGLTDKETEGIFKWLGETTGTSFKYFAANEPGGGRSENSFAILAYDDYRWHDVGCHLQFSYICEYEL